MHGSEMRNTDRVLVGKSEGKIPLVRSRRRLVDTIKMDLIEIRCECVEWIHWLRIETNGVLL
jgi:hypothetical protein